MRCTSGCAATPLPPTISSPTTRPCRCSIRGAGAPGPEDSGSTRATSGPGGGPAPPAAIHLFAPDRKAVRPVAHLEDSKGILHVDGYAGFEKLTGDGDVVLAACWGSGLATWLLAPHIKVTGSPSASVPS